MNTTDTKGRLDAALYKAIDLVTDDVIALTYDTRYDADTQTKINYYVNEVIEKAAIVLVMKVNSDPAFAHACHTYATLLNALSNILRESGVDNGLCNEVWVVSVDLSIAAMDTALDAADLPRMN